jgi:hypothetical protein
LLADETRDAAAAYHKAKARLAEALRLYGILQEAPRPWPAETDEWDRWTGLMMHAATQAHDRLAATVMAACGRIDSARDIPRLPDEWEPCALRLDGRVYVVGPTSVADPEPQVHVLDAILDGLNPLAERGETR